MVRGILGTLILALGLWLFREVSVYEGVVSTRMNVDVWSLFRTEPAFALRFAGAVFIAVGGAFLIGSKWLGLISLGLGTVCFLILTGSMIALGADISLWKEEALLSAGLVVLSLLSLTLKT